MPVGSGRGIAEVPGKPRSEGDFGEDQSDSSAIIRFKIPIPKNPIFRKENISVSIPVPKFLYRVFSLLFGKIRSVGEHPSFRKYSIAIIVVLLLLTAAKEGAEWYFVRRVINLRGVKELAREFINVELDRAVTLGVVEYEFPNHVFIEDLKISSDEDFASQRMIFRANKVELVLRGLWKGQPSVKSIRVKNAQISVDLEDKISGEILSYIHKINVPEISLENSSVTVYKGGKILLENVKDVDLDIHKEGNQIDVQISDSLFPIPGFRYLKGNFRTDIGTKNMSLSLHFKNARASAVGGLYSELSPFYPKTGKISGEADLEVDGASIRGKGNTQFSDVGGILLLDLPLREENWEWRDANLSHEWDRSFQGQSISENHKVFFGSDKLTLTKTKNEKGLQTWDLTMNVQDLDDLRNYLPLSSDLDTFTGALDLIWKGTETGNYGDWLKSDAKLTLRDFHWKDPYLDLGIQNASFSWNPSGLEFSGYGTQFGLPWKASLKGKAGFRKGFKGDGRAYFPLQGDYSLDFETDSLVLSNYLPLFRSVRQTIREDIHTRMEKLIPEIKFIRTEVYKYFMEYPSGTVQFRSKETKFDSGLPDMGRLEAILKFSASQSRLEGKIKGSGEAKLNSYFTYGADNPYFGIDFQTTGLAWGIPALTFCGGTLIPEALDSEGTIRFNGNNFLDIHDRIYTTIDKVRLLGTIWKGEGEFPVSISPKFEMGFDYASPGNPPLRNVYWKSDNTNATANVYVDSDSSLRYSVTGSVYSTSAESGVPTVNSSFFTRFKETGKGCIKEQ
ncbi:LIC_12586 family protein [Leptospira wolffii]|uniref:LIC_12586 family protein n=1 Tax=Leptospira wolffii TaxID=409998 RepID=UPI001FD3032D|nr:AsmA family protein [Leptospira wolffii]